MTIGFILKCLREAKKISQKQLAKTLNISISSIYRFENGGKINFDDYLKYCTCLNILPYIPVIIHNNNKIRQLFNECNNEKFDKDTKEVIISTLIQELSDGVSLKIEEEFNKVDEIISDDTIKLDS